MAGYRGAFFLLKGGIASDDDNKEIMQFEQACDLQGEDKQEPSSPRIDKLTES